MLRLNAKGEVQEEIALPGSLSRHAVRFGLEGVTTTGEGAQETVWLAVQREWRDDPKGLVKILRYTPATRTWGVPHYPLDTTYVLDKVESFAVDAAGHAFAVTDNDGVEGGASGEAQFLRLGQLPGLR